MDRRAVLLGLVVASLANISSFTATNRLSSSAEVTCGEVCIVGDTEGVDSCYYWENEDIKPDHTSLNVKVSKHCWDQVNV